MVERLLDAANAELAVRPIVEFEYREDPEIGLFAVPDRLWSVPVPDCFARVQVLSGIFGSDDEIWGLSDRTERIAHFELVPCQRPIPLPCCGGAGLVAFIEPGWPGRGTCWMRPAPPPGQVASCRAGDRPPDRWRSPSSPPGPPRSAGSRAARTARSAGCQARVRRPPLVGDGALTSADRVAVCAAEPYGAQLGDRASPQAGAGCSARGGRCALIVRSGPSDRSVVWMGGGNSS